MAVLCRKTEYDIAAETDFGDHFYPDLPLSWMTSVWEDLLLFLLS